jgi:Domain of unknown function (DUF4410)
MKTIPLVILAANAMLFSGCVGTFKEVKPLTFGNPPQDRPKVLALRGIKVTDTRWSEPEEKMMVHAFHFGVEKWCADNSAFVCISESSTNVPPESIVLSGNITEIEKGSIAARILVGMGAGQQRAVGEFQIVAADGTRLAAFTARKSYLGGAGIGGLDMMSIQDLVAELGQLVAQTTDKWLRGEKVQQTRNLKSPQNGAGSRPSKENGDPLLVPISH